MKELSVFIDESGDFGEIKERPAYYIVTMVFHDQSNSIYDEIKNMIAKHQDYFESYEKIIVYYDYGQSELSSILNAVFSLLFNEVEFRKAEPQKYKLLQVADFVCSMELLKIKRNENRLSKSEAQFFYKPQELKKTFLTSMVSFHFTPISQEKALKAVKLLVSNLQKMVIDEQKSAARQGYGMENISPQLRRDVEAAEKLMDDVSQNDEKMFMESLYIRIFVIRPTRISETRFVMSL